MNRKIILIGPSSFGELDDKPLHILKNANCEVVSNPFKRRYTKQETIELLQKNIDGLIAGLEPLDREVLEKVPNLKVISRCGSGMSNVDVEAAAKLGITVCSTPDGPTLSVAEMTVGCMISLLRNIPQMNNSLHDGVWDKRIGNLLSEKTVAIIGFGKIGKKVVELIRPFQPRLLIVDPYLQEPPSIGVNVSLDEALEEADIFSLHLAGESCIFNENIFSKMKPGAIILNAARGGNISESALVDAVNKGTVAAAWLDALPHEPYEGPLQHLEQVILTPHVGSYTREGRLKMETDCVKNLLTAFGK